MIGGAPRGPSKSKKRSEAGRARVHSRTSEAGLWRKRASVSSGVSPAWAVYWVAALVVHPAELARELDDDLIEDLLLVRLVLRALEAIEEGLEGRRGVGHDGAHLGHGLQGRVEVHGVVDLEGLLADLGAEPRRPAIIWS